MAIKTNENAANFFTPEEQFFLRNIFFQNFDPSLKKKKKKKKTPFDLDGALNEGGEDREASKDDDAVADDIDLDSFGTKKKKKKKPIIVEDEDKDEDAKEEGNNDKKEGACFKFSFQIINGF